MATKSAYGASAEEICDLFLDYLEGDATRPAIALSSKPLPKETRSAIEKSLEALGFSGPACTFATLCAHDVSIEGADIELDPQALFLLVEGIDPLHVIATDRHAAERLAQTYRAAFDLDVTTRLMGRTCAIFENLTALLETSQGKQKAWSILKSLR